MDDWQCSLRQDGKNLIVYINKILFFDPHIFLFCSHTYLLHFAKYRPISELFDRPITKLIDNDLGLNLSPIVDNSDRAPSLLNGGLDNISPLFWGFCLGLTAAIDIKGVQNARYNDDDGDQGSSYLPGDYGFDPLGLYPSDKEGQERMQLAEIKHGRLGMLAITAFAAQEFVSKVGVVDETPIFFQPIHF